MDVQIGTSGFSYPKWKGSFYPAKLPAKDMLAYYASRLGTVEVNNTFYRLPAPKMFIDWAAQVPTDFTFAVKASQRITHMQRLKPECKDALDRLLEVAGVLGARLGPILFQLPPNMKKDLPRLRDFLALLPEGCRATFEFREPAWFCDELYTMLADRGCALAIAETEAIEPPVVATTDWGYLRLRREDYVAADVARWGEVILAQKWKRAFVYFKHEDSGTGPKLAAQLIDVIGAAQRD